MNWEGCVGVSGGCLGVVVKTVWRMWRGCFWKMWGSCLEGVLRLSGVCGEVVWGVWEGSLKSLGRLSRGCGEAV